MKTSPSARQLHALWLGNASTADLHAAFARLLRDCAAADIALAKAEALLSDVEQLRARLLRGLISPPSGAANAGHPLPAQEPAASEGAEVVPIPLHVVQPEAGE